MDYEEKKKSFIKARQIRREYLEQKVQELGKRLDDFIEQVKGFVREQNNDDQ